MRFPGRTLAVVTLLAAVGATPAMADEIRVQSTTDTVDAGLVEGLLRPGYLAAQPGDTLNYVGVGTGAALTNARNGLADVVITHAPTLEKQFSDDGFSLEGKGRAIFCSDYVIVGPKTDPAGVAANDPHDAVGALERIAAAGSAGNASFVSRGDNSGTNVQEQLMWHMTGSAVTKSTASNAPAGVTNRDEPTTGTVGTYPAWYRQTKAGQAASLTRADACSAPDAPVGNCYTMVDRGTFNRVQASGTLTKLTILSENNDPAARGGKDLLINPFSAYIVTPSKVPAGSPPVNVAAATRFLDYLTSPGFQAAVDTFPTATNPAFRGDAFPAVAVDAPLPPTAAAGSTVSVGLTLSNKQPGTPAVGGQPVQLQSSVDGGATWADAGAPQNTDALGHVTLAAAVGSTTSYRISTGRFVATDWNAFSPSTQAIGTVAVPAPVAPTPPTTPTPATPKPAADRKAPTATRFTLTPRRVTLRLSEAGSVRVTIERRVVKRVRRSGKLRSVVSYVRVKTVRGSLKKAGTLRLTWKAAIARGATYRVTARSVDAAKNVRTQKRTIAVKR